MKKEGNTGCIDGIFVIIVMILGLGLLGAIFQGGTPDDTFFTGFLGLGIIALILYLISNSRKK